MVLKIGFLIVFLLLFQSLEAKKKRQETGISTYIKGVGNFFQDAWDGFLSLLSTTNTKPSKQKKNIKKDKIVVEKTNITQDQSIIKDKNTTKNKNNKKNKKTKKKKVRKNSWGLDSMMKSAKKNLNSIYTSVTDLFQSKRSKKSLDNDGHEMPLEDILNNILSDVISKFAKKHKIKELKNS